MMIMEKTRPGMRTARSSAAAAECTLSMHLGKLQHSRDVLSQRVDICAALADFGCHAVAYIGPLSDEEGQARQLTNIGFPKEWEVAYRSQWHRHDPLPNIAQSGRAIFWLGDGTPSDRLTPQEQHYMSMLSQWGMRDCVGVLCIGRNMRTGFALIGGRDKAKLLERPDLGALQAIVQVSFLRYCTLLEEELPKPALSEREHQVLKLLAQGKTKTAIADTTALSDGSVDTYCRRLYKKLDAKDRASAVLKGVSCGLVSIPAALPSSVYARQAETLAQAG